MAGQFRNPYPGARYTNVIGHANEELHNGRDFPLHSLSLRELRVRQYPASTLGSINFFSLQLSREPPRPGQTYSLHHRPYTWMWMTLLCREQLCCATLVTRPSQGGHDGIFTGFGTVREWRASLQKRQSFKERPRLGPTTSQPCTLYGIAARSHPCAPSERSLHSLTPASLFKALGSPGR